MAFVEGGEAPALREVALPTRPKGLDAGARRRFERLNRRVALAAFCALVIGAAVLAWTELRSAWLAHRGWRLMHEDPLNPEEAIAPFQEAARLKRTNASAIKGLWQAQSIMGLHDEALRTARRRLRVEPTTEARVELARTILRGSMSPADACEEAAPYLDKAARADPRALLPLEILLECYDVLGDAQRWSETQRELIGRYEDFRSDYIGLMRNRHRIVRATAFNNVAWVMLTAKAPQFLDYEQALAYAQEAVDLSRDDPSRYVFLDTLAEAYWCNGRPREALAMIDEALALEPENLHYYVTQKRKFLRALEGLGAPARGEGASASEDGEQP